MCTDLQSDFDFFGEGSLWEYGLHLRDHCGAEHASLSTDGVRLLADARHNSEVLGEVSAQDPGDALVVEFLGVLQVCVANNNNGSQYKISTTCLDTFGS